MLFSRSGATRLAEVWGIFFDTGKLALKQSFDATSFFVPDEGGIAIDGCLLTPGRTKGEINSRGHVLKWDLEINPRSDLAFDLVPQGLKKVGLVKNYAVTVNEDLVFNGQVLIDGRPVQFVNARGMQGHLSGERNGHSWVWSHCNIFKNRHGKSEDFIFEGFSGRSRIGGIVPSPKLSSFLFVYKGREYRFNNVWDCIRNKSENGLTYWKFVAEKGDLVFRGTLEATLSDFAGVTYEDTDGSFLYCSNSNISDLQILVYRGGRLEETMKADGTAAFEIVSRKKNPYVPLVI
ncbi:MAG: hypothetical protein AABZ06_03260 [Bdellovibrionota bacterium]